MVPLSSDYFEIRMVGNCSRCPLKHIMSRYRFYTEKIKRKVLTQKMQTGSLRRLDWQQGRLSCSSRVEQERLDFLQSSAHTFDSLMGILTNFQSSSVESILEPSHISKSKNKFGTWQLDPNHTKHPLTIATYLVKDFQIEFVARRFS